MRLSTIIILLASIGFILMGIITSNNKAKNLLQNTGVFTDVDKFIKVNLIFNLLIGIIGICLGIVDYMLIEKSRYIQISFIIVIAVLSLIQRSIGKNYRNV